MRSPAGVATLAVLGLVLVVGMTPMGTLGVAREAPPAEGEPIDHVDPTIGTVAPGFVNPGPIAPHGMVWPGPDTEGPFNYGGYFVHDTVVTGFSQTHMSAGVPHAGHFPVMPVVGDVETRDVSGDAPGSSPIPAYASPFDHATEEAEVGRYAVTLERYGVRAELSATERAAIHEYAFPLGSDAKIVVDASRNLRGYDLASLTLHGDGLLTGTVTTDVRGPYSVHTAIRLDHGYDVHLPDGTELAPGDTATGERLAAVLDVDEPTERVRVKVGVSYTDETGALRNLDAEIPGWSLADVRERTRSAWEEELSTVEVDGGTEAAWTSFYSALYRAHHFPNLHSDVDHRYRWDEGPIREAEVPRYSQFSLWDSYNGQNQLLAVTEPDRYRNMVTSLADLADATGSLPQWQLAGHDAGYMSGNSAIPFVAEAWCRGLLDALPTDRRARLYDHMQALVDDRPLAYEEKGYLPVPRPASPIELVDGGPRDTGTTLEYGIADAALALVADAETREADRDELLDGALNYRNLVDPDTTFLRPRHADGSWLEPFSPEGNYGFQEGTSWQYSWLAPQDLAGLVDAMGGRDVVEERLDELFSFPATANLPGAPGKAQTHLTVFGLFYAGDQYAPGNEHDLQAPFVYNYAGEPWKTQAVARGVASTFTPTPDGLPGNDDLGALSGWLVWTMMGLYPVTPGAPVYQIASPVFDEIRLDTHRGEVSISAPGSSWTDKYVQSARLGEQPLERAWVREDELLHAGDLGLEMGPVPNPSWGAEQGPPSLSTHDPSAFGCSPEAG